MQMDSRSSIPQNALLEMVDVRAGYGKHIVLHKIDLMVRRGEWCALLGPNGAGKSTLLHSIVGRVTPMSGNISVNGCSIPRSLSDALRHVGFGGAPENLPGLLTGRQCMIVYAAAKELAGIDAKVLDLAAALKFTPFLDRYVDTYSLGTRQKLCVLLALLGNPSLLVFDEAFNGLDPGSSLVLKRYLRAEVDAGNCSVLLATHALDIVEHFADSAALLMEGKIIRNWNRDALTALRTEGSSLEVELAAAAEEY